MRSLLATQRSFPLTGGISFGQTRLPTLRRGTRPSSLADMSAVTKAPPSDVYS